jgi:hypothetical protein
VCWQRNEKFNFPILIDLFINDAVDNWGIIFIARDKIYQYFMKEVNICHNGMSISIFDKIGMKLLTALQTASMEGTT